MICGASRDKRIAMSPKRKSSAPDIAGRSNVFASRFGSRWLLPCAVLVVISLALYYNYLGNNFVFDDYAVIVENKHLNDLGNSLPAFLSDSYFKIAGGESSYRPIPTLSYFLIHSLSGPDPFYFHLGSVALHTLNVLLVYILFALLLGLTLLTIAGYLRIHSLRPPDAPRSLQADIGIRLGATGLVLAYVCGLADLIGIGTHVEPAFGRPHVGPLQMGGLIVGTLMIVAGLLLYYTSRGSRESSSLESLLPNSS